jgi:hypothetical protein
MSFIQELFTSRNNGAAAADFVGKQGRIWWDPVTNRFYYSDGITVGGIPIGAGDEPAYGELATETYEPIAGQNEFTLLHTPVGQVTGSINGATIVAAALIETGALITYDSTLNGDYVILEGDLVTFTYLYGTVGPSSLGNLGDVTLTEPQNGQFLMYNGTLNQWVAGNPGRDLQSGIQNGTSRARIFEPDADIKFTVAGMTDVMVVGTKGIDLTDAGYRVNGYLAVNGPSLQIENRNSAIDYDMCDRPIDVIYNQPVPADIQTIVEYNRLCWDTVSKFNPTANPITIGGVAISPWSWRPMVDGYYSVTARLTLDDPSTPIGSAGTKLVSEEFLAKAAQTVFNIQSVPKGAVVFVINGATIPVTAYTIDSKTITYIPASNSDYIILKDDEISINYITGGTQTLVLNSKSIVAAAGQTDFTLPTEPTGVVMVSMNGATLPSHVMLIDGTSAVYSSAANDGYIIREGDVISFNYFVGSSGNKTLTSESFHIRPGESTFNLSEYPSGKVIASLNGAILPPRATQVSRKTVIYSAQENDGYVPRTDDVITFTYIGIETRFGSEDWAVLSIAVNGVIVSSGCKSMWINKTIDVQVDTQLLLTPTDNISILVLQHTDQQLRVLESMLSATMIRGIE